MLMMRTVWTAAGVLLLSNAAAWGQAPALAEREIRVGKDHRVTLSMPASWKVSHERGEASTYSKIDTRNNDVSIQLTTAVVPPGGKLTPASLPNLLTAQGTGLLAQSVEGAVSLKELHAKSGTGFYFALTDRAPSKTGYRYLIQGGELVGDLFISFTVLHRVAEAPEAAQGLEMLRSVTVRL